MRQFPIQCIWERGQWSTDLAGGRGAGTVLAVAGQHVGGLVDQDLPDALQWLLQDGTVGWGTRG